MKVLRIRRLVEKYTISQLQEAEHAIIKEKPLGIDLDGKDDAEKLTSVIAAVWILEEMKRKDLEFKDAFCEYNKKVRA